MAGLYEVNWQPVQNALAQWQKRDQLKAQEALARARMAQQDKQWSAGNALAQAQFGLMRNRDERSAGIQPLELQLKQAQIDFQKARIGALRNAQTASTVTAPDPTAKFAMRKDGSIYELGGGDSGPSAPAHRSIRKVLGDSVNASPVARREHLDFGQYGLTTPEIPGLVTRPTKSRASDKFGTQLYQGQRALDRVPDEDRQRYIEWRNVQNRWHLTHQTAPPKGYVYNPDGSLRDLKEESRKEIGRNKIEALMDDVRVASTVFKDSWYPSRAAAHATGGWVSPKYEQAARSVEHAVQFLTAEVEGKRHANAQDVRMLKFFAPDLKHDSAEMIGFKLDQLNRIMSNYFGAKTPSGSLFRSSLAKANEEYHRQVKSGEIKAPEYSTRLPPGAGPGAGYGVPHPGTGTMPDAPRYQGQGLSIPPQTRHLKNKYGLE